MESQTLEELVRMFRVKRLVPSSEEAEAQRCGGVQPWSCLISLTVVPTVWYACQLAREPSHMVHGSADQPAWSRSLIAQQINRWENPKSTLAPPTLGREEKKLSSIPWPAVQFEANGSPLFNIWLMQFTVLKQHTILQRVPIWLKQTKTLFLDYLDLLFQKIMDVNLRYYFSTKIVFLFFFFLLVDLKKLAFESLI